MASSGPAIAPRLSIARSNPYARPYTCAGTTSASSALRAGTRSPRAVQAAARNTPACHGATAAPIAEDSTAVNTYPPTATRRRGRVIGQRPAAEPGHPAQRIRDALDQPQRRRRRAQHRGQKRRQQRGRDLVADIGQEARRADPADRPAEPPSAVIPDPPGGHHGGSA